MLLINLFSIYLCPAHQRENEPDKSEDVHGEGDQTVVAHEEGKEVNLRQGDRSRGAEGRSRGAEEQGSSGAGEQRRGVGK